MHRDPPPTPSLTVIKYQGLWTSGNVGVLSDPSAFGSRACSAVIRPTEMKRAEPQGRGLSPLRMEGRAGGCTWSESDGAVFYWARATWEGTAWLPAQRSSSSLRMGVPWSTRRKNGKP